MIISIVLAAFLLTVISIIFTQKVFIKKKSFDEINLRSSHDTIATRSGGLAIFIVLFIVSTYFYLSGIELYDFSILVPLSIIFLIGLYDDLNGVDFKLKFIFQIIVAKIIIDNGFIIDNLHGVFGVFEISRIMAQILTIFIIVAIINAINFIDGIDGLAVSSTLLFIISYEYFALNTTNFYYLNFILITSLIPLYYFNYRKKDKVFLGDSGSYLLGVIVSIYILNILSQDYIIKPDFDLHKVLFVITLLFYPIVDIIRIFLIRIYNGRSPFLADKKHIHHLFNDFFNSHIKTTLSIVFLSLMIISLVQIIINQKIPFVG